LLLLLLMILLTALQVFVFGYVKPPLTISRAHSWINYVLKKGPRPQTGHWVPLAGFSPELRRAVVASEDQRFLSHHGFDFIELGQALRSLREGGYLRGASTITMQLARNLFLPPEKRYDPSVDRKALEMNIAQELTALYSKDEILEMYLNLLNYGQLAYGPEAAAQVYFGKSASDLSLAEASFLAGIPQQPANLNPYKNFEAVRQRQQVVLALMVRHGYLTQAQADQAFAQGIELAGDPGLAPGTPG